jgi:hypothetical protein
VRVLYRDPDANTRIEHFRVRILDDPAEHQLDAMAGLALRRAVVEYIGDHYAVARRRAIKPALEPLWGSST